MPHAATLSAAELLRAVAAAPQLAQHDILIYDGDCRFCIAQVARLGRWAGTVNGKPALAPIPLQTPGILAALGISEAAARRAMQLVTSPAATDGGRIYSGLEAAVQALRQRPLLGRLARLYYVPGIRQLGDLGYRLVARYRYRILGRAVARGDCDGSCALHLPPLQSAAGRQVVDAGGGDAAR
jgi:predicted DCC family thiol-disulfide oxidoreductase YuxK